MSKVYLFDWGDTLMVDFPNQSGHMTDWPQIAEVNGAYETLKKLSLCSKVFVATGSVGTSVSLMKRAFARTTLAPYIYGYFCPNNVGYEKPSAEFYHEIAKQLTCEVADITMVGDNLVRDILPALEIGMSAIWLNSHNQLNPNHVIEISMLTELV